MGGDSLLEPFWPQGTGLNKAVLSCLDTAHFLEKYYQLPTDEKWTDHLQSVGRLFDQRAKNLNYMHSASPNELQKVDKREIMKLKKKQHGHFVNPSNRYKKSAPVLSRSRSGSRHSLSHRKGSAKISKASEPALPTVADGELDLSALQPPHFASLPEEGHMWFRPAYHPITFPAPS